MKGITVEDGRHHVYRHFPCRASDQSYIRVVLVRVCWLPASYGALPRFFDKGELRAVCRYLSADHRNGPRSIDYLGWVGNGRPSSRLELAIWQ